MRKKTLYQAIENYQEHIKDLKAQHLGNIIDIETKHKQELETLKLELRAHKKKIQELEKLDSDQLIEYAIKQMTVREIPEDFEPKEYKNAVVEGKNDY